MVALSCAGARRPTAAARAPEPAAERLRAFSPEERARIARLQPLVRRVARRHEVPWPLVDGVIWVESKFESRARGKHGPRGLMQLMPRTARAIARKLHRRYRPYSAAFNVEAGTYYLASMLERFSGDRVLALAAYQRGPGAVRRDLRSGRPLPQRTQRYVAHVLSAARAFRKRF